MRHRDSSYPAEFNSYPIELGSKSSVSAYRFDLDNHLSWHLPVILFNFSAFWQKITFETFLLCRLFLTKKNFVAEINSMMKYEDFLDSFMQVIVRIIWNKDIIHWFWFVWWFCDLQVLFSDPLPDNRVFRFRWHCDFGDKLSMRFFRMLMSRKLPQELVIKLRHQNQ